MFEISFSPEALRDLQQTKKYISEELSNDIAAIQTLVRIVNRIQELATFPQMGAPLSSIVEMDTDYRYLVCGNYTAFYRVDGQSVYIVRVLYGRRDFMSVLFGKLSDDGIDK